ncbi:MAG: hypothetical protein M3388_13065 [Acidobacteriota bacterium]|nr:hypothetical protein [Acidobacteriota bacterium]
MKKFRATMIQFFTMKLQFQPRGSLLLLISVFIFIFLFATTPATNQAQEVIKGEWFIDFSRPEPDKVQLTLIKQKMRGGNKYTHSSGVPISEIQSLSREQVSDRQKEVKFHIEREAGTFELEGFFREGKGAGFLTLMPNRSFVSAMDSRGYGNMNEDDLFSAAANDVSVKIIDDLKSAGYDRLSFKEIIEADIFKLSSEYVRDLKTAGYENLTFKDLLEVRVFKIDSQFVKEIQTAGFASLPLKTLVELRVYKITSEFIRTARNRLGSDLTVRQILDLKRLGIVKESGGK